MTWYKNKKTGLKWEVTGELAERLARSDDFVKVESPQAKKDLTVEELQDIAKEKGIKGYSRMKKDELINALKG